MDPVSTAIIAGLATGVVTGTAKVGEQVIVDAYNALKTAIRQKFGDNSDVIEAVEHLEKKPDAKTRQTGVAEEIKAAQVDKDPDLIIAAETLLTALNKTPAGQQAIAKYSVSAKNIGVVGDDAHIHGGIHFGDN